MSGVLGIKVFVPSDFGIDERYLIASFTATLSPRDPALVTLDVRTSEPHGRASRKTHSPVYSAVVKCLSGLFVKRVQNNLYIVFFSQSANQDSALPIPAANSTVTSLTWIANSGFSHVPPHTTALFCYYT